MEFYNSIADHYDAMTRFHERMFKETARLNRWIDRYGFQSVLDAACGTGLHVIALASLGLRAVGADLSAAMLRQAERHAIELDVPVLWVQASMQQLRQQVEGEFDAVLCVGNSLPHLLEQTELEAALHNFYALLAPGGTLILQLLNYHRILAEQQRIVSIQRCGDDEFVRFYDFHRDRLMFNLLIMHWNDGVCEHSLHSTPLYPYQKDELVYELSQQAFTSFEYYGNMDFEPYAEQSSNDLVIVARK
jgi:glycine/sarcosine N-methyltransferase